MAAQLDVDRDHVSLKKTNKVKTPSNVHLSNVNVNKLRFHSELDRITGGERFSSVLM